MRTRLAAAAVLAASVALVNLPSSQAQAGASGPSSAPRYQEYVALGDSWSADVVFLNGDGLPDTTYAPIDCAQSHTNYPKLVAAQIGVPTFRDATCGSATTDHFAHPQSLPLGGTNPPQYDRLTPTTDLVTVGIGGNDAGFAGAALACISLLPIATIPMDLLPLPDLPLPLISTSTLPVGGCKEYFTSGGVDRLALAIEQSEDKLVTAFQEIHRLSPEARILAVNYLAAIPRKGCWPLVPITNSDMRYLYDTFAQLNAMVARAARRGGAELVDTYSPTVGHDICKGPRVRYAEALGPSINDPAIGVPAHPNAAGARAQAQAVTRYLRRHP
ncbi:SGNH/GDSL hydrolase family protein [Nocardioides humilatus]|uniref:SGNH/GDSL hydrolase family protein n=1 Tax=Nocardioides humilatus TaxID=2607660 RepID=A0A5B1LDS3_9ACTN|nr:SGNH/GDSL hydrolase family protein [Nocardioides humilatus]KAA1417757.1 SGNH/GDSL hydrolase family protein [Nocardioides humilatus]